MYSEFFSPQAWSQQTYTQARKDFLFKQQQCQDLAFVTSKSYVHPLQSPFQEQLSTDVFWLGPKDSSQVVVLISGTHGIEGYTGSAIQRFILSMLCKKELSLPADTALLFVHALNPWGMAWYRRCDEQGIDVNRNFMDFLNPLPIDPAYSFVRPWMFCTDSILRKQELQHLAVQLGKERFEEALSGGQYEDATAPFYGGRASSIARNCIEDLMQQYRLGERDLVVLDLHTGLGAWGYGELMCDHPFNSPQQQYAQRLFGAAVTMSADGTSSSVPKKGLLDYAWHAIMNSNSCFLTFEFGTYSTERLFNTVIEDHCLWASEADPYVAMQKSKEGMLSHFCPADIFWERSVLFQAWQAMQILFTRRECL